RRSRTVRPRSSASFQTSMRYPLGSARSGVVVVGIVPVGELVDRLVGDQVVIISAGCDILGGEDDLARCGAEASGDEANLADGRGGWLLPEDDPESID